MELFLYNSETYNKLDVLKDKGFLFLDQTFNDYIGVIDTAGNIRNQQVTLSHNKSKKFVEDVATDKYDEEINKLIEEEINVYGKGL